MHLTWLVQDNHDIIYIYIISLYPPGSTGIHLPWCPWCQLFSTFFPSDLPTQVVRSVEPTSVMKHLGITNAAVIRWPRDIKGQWGVPLTVYPWYLLCSTLGFLGITYP